MKICSVENCEKPSKCRGYCGGHYTRWARHGDPLATHRLNYNGAPCRVEQCEKRAVIKGLCHMHDQRVRRYGSVDYVTPESERRKRCRAAQPKLGKLKPTTYPKFLGRHLHRQVAEQKLGRPLREGEIVHHLDGNKHNNNPDNLEVVLDQSHHVRRHRRIRGRLTGETC